MEAACVSEQVPEAVPSSLLQLHIFVDLDLVNVKRVRLRFESCLARGLGVQKLYLLCELLKRIVDAVFHLDLIYRQLCVSLVIMFSSKLVVAKKLHRVVKEVIFSREV